MSVKLDFHNALIIWKSCFQNFEETFIYARNISADKNSRAEVNAVIYIR